MGKTKSSDIVGKIVDLLTPLSSEERRRVVSASLTLLGEATNASAATETEDGGTITTSGKAKAWQNQNKITANHLGQVFHCEDGKVEVIVGEMPGKNKKEKTLNAYVLAGIAQLLISGEAKFTDKDARALCSSAGCYDAPNHAATLKAKGNWFTGTKEKGWVLTAPGLKHAATLVRNLTSEQA
jgi:hypothetical protein